MKQAIGVAVCFAGPTPADQPVSERQPFDASLLNGLIPPYELVE
jgi:hypothetical protein